MSLNYKVIGPKYFSDIDNSAIEEIAALGSYNRKLVYGLNPWSSALRNYLILTHKPSLVKDAEITELKLLFNRYYWFKKFYHSYSLRNGKDAGIEQ
jgi:hypothetical protein